MASCMNEDITQIAEDHEPALLSPRSTFEDGRCVICEELACLPCPCCGHSYCEHGFVDGPYGEYARWDVWQCRHCGCEARYGSAKTLRANTPPEMPPGTDGFGALHGSPSGVVIA